MSGVFHDINSSLEKYVLPHLSDSVYFMGVLVF